MPKARWSKPGYSEPLVRGRLTDRFLQTMEESQRLALDAEAERLGIDRTEYVRRAVYHYMNCEEGCPHWS